jgi:hypothetical protein
MALFAAPAAIIEIEKKKSNTGDWFLHQKCQNTQLDRTGGSQNRHSGIFAPTKPPPKKKKKKMTDDNRGEEMPPPPLLVRPAQPIVRDDSFHVESVSMDEIVGASGDGGDDVNNCDGDATPSTNFESTQSSANIASTQSPAAASPRLAAGEPESKSQAGGSDDSSTQAAQGRTPMQKLRGLSAGLKRGILTSVLRRSREPAAADRYVGGFRLRSIGNNYVAVVLCTRGTLYNPLLIYLGLTLLVLVHKKKKKKKKKKI